METAEKSVSTHFLLIAATLVAVAALAGFALGQYMFKTVPHGFSIALSPQPLVEEMALAGSSAQASFDPASGRMLVEVVLPPGKLLPANSFMEGFLVEESRDPFYELSTGRLTSVGRGGRYIGFFLSENSLFEYDAIKVTLEEDSDPRPDRVLFRGAIK